MSEKSAPDGTNWLFGLDKLTTPSLDFIGIKLRDQLRTYLNNKTRERALLRKFEKEFLYRQIEFFNYGTEQYSAWLDTISVLMIDRHFESTSPLIKLAITHFKILPDRAFQCIIDGFNQNPVKYSEGEFILYAAGSGVLDLLLAVHSAKCVFNLANLPASVHAATPEVSDEELEKMLASEDTLKLLADNIEVCETAMTKHFAKAIVEAYGQKFDEAELEAHMAEAKKQRESEKRGSAHH